MISKALQSMSANKVASKPRNSTIALLKAHKILWCHHVLKRTGEVTNCGKIDNVLIKVAKLSVDIRSGG